HQIRLGIAAASGDEAVRDVEGGTASHARPKCPVLRMTRRPTGARHFPRNLNALPGDYQKAPLCAALRALDDATTIRPEFRSGSVTPDLQKWPTSEFGNAPAQAWNATENRRDAPPCRRSQLPDQNRVT